MSKTEIYTISPAMTTAAYYRFETGALTTDSSGNGHTLTAISDPAETTGVFGGGVLLDADDAYSAVDHSDFKPTGNFTMGCWLKKNGVPSGTSDFIMQSGSANLNIAGIKLFIVVSTGQLRLQSGKNSGTTADVDYKNATGTVNVCDNEWHFLVGTWDGSYLRVYVDGKLDAAAVSWANAPVYDATNYVRVGCFCGGGTDGQNIDGSLDDVFYLNGTALSAEEIAGIYYGYKKISGVSMPDIKYVNGIGLRGNELIKTTLGTDANLKAYYRFESGALTTDTTAGAHTLTAVQSPDETTGRFGGGVAMTAVTTYDYTTTTSDSSFATNYWQAQAFTPSSNGTFVLVWLYLKKVGSPTGTLTVEIRNDSSGAPGSTLIASGSINSANLTTSYAATQASWAATAVSLTSGTKYHICLKGQSSWDSSNDVLWGFESGTGFAQFNYGAGNFSSNNTTTRCAARGFYAQGYSAVNHADFRPTGNFTVGFWIKNTATASSQMVFQSWYNPSLTRYGIRCFLNALTAKPSIQSAKGTGDVQGTDFQQISGNTAITDGNWHFVVGTWDGSYLYIYVDGISDAPAVSWSSAPSYHASNNVAIGYSLQNTVYATPMIDSSLDDLFLLNGTALSAAQVKTLYDGFKNYNGI